MKYAALILTIAVLVSCQSPMINEHPASLGSVQVSFASGARTVVPNWDTAITSYKVTLTSKDGNPSHETTAAVGESATLTAVDAGTWDVSVAALNGTTQVGAGSLTSQVLTSGGTLSLTVPVSSTQDGTGSFSFKFAVPSSTKVGYVTGQLYDPTSGATVGDLMVAALTSNGTNREGTIGKTGFASGAYRLAVKFHWGGPLGAVAGTFSEAINVWDNVTSDQWLSSAGAFKTLRTFSESEIRSVPTLAGDVTTLAGTTDSGSADGTGSAAQFYGPSYVATDNTNLYLSDAQNHLIRKIVIATGVVTTLAGSGSPGSADGVGTAASFNFPQGLATDGTNLYVADADNHVIRKIVIASGAVSTLAGSGTPSSADGFRTAAGFYSPRGLATDGTNLYVADYRNNRIRQVVLATGVVTTLAGGSRSGDADGTGTSAQFNRPDDVATDGTNLYVTEGRSSRIRQIVLATGAVTTLASWQDYRYEPQGIATDGINLYVTSDGSHELLRIDQATGVATVIAGSYGVFGSSDGTGTAAQFYLPYGIALSPSDPTRLFLADNSNNMIRMVR